MLHNGDQSDYYRYLGIRRNAHLKHISIHYREISRCIHPDRCHEAFNHVNGCAKEPKHKDKCPEEVFNTCETCITHRESIEKKMREHHISRLGMTASNVTETGQRKPFNRLLCLEIMTNLGNAMKVINLAKDTLSNKDKRETYDRDHPGHGKDLKEDDLMTCSICKADRYGILMASRTETSKHIEVHFNALKGHFKDRDRPGRLNEISEYMERFGTYKYKNKFDFVCIVYNETFKLQDTRSIYDLEYPLHKGMLHDNDAVQALYGNFEDRYRALQIRRNATDVHIKNHMLELRDYYCKNPCKLAIVENIFSKTFSTPDRRSAYDHAKPAHGIDMTPDMEAIRDSCHICSVDRYRILRTRRFASDDHIKEHYDLFIEADVKIRCTKIIDAGGRASLSKSIELIKTVYHESFKTIELRQLYDSEYPDHGKRMKKEELDSLCEACHPDIYKLLYVKRSASRQQIETHLAELDTYYRGRNPKRFAVIRALYEDLLGTDYLRNAYDAAYLYHGSFSPEPPWQPGLDTRYEEGTQQILQQLNEEDTTNDGDTKSSLLENIKIIRNAKDLIRTTIKHVSPVGHSHSVEQPQAITCTQCQGLWLESYNRLRQKLREHKAQGTGIRDAT